MKGEIATVVTMMGEVVGRVKSMDDNSVTLESPRLFVPAQDQAGGGFAPGVSMTGEQDLDEGKFNLNVALTVVKTHEAVAKGWTQAVSGIVLAS